MTSICIWEPSFCPQISFDEDAQIHHSHVDEGSILYTAMEAMGFCYLLILLVYYSNLRLFIQGRLPSTVILHQRLD